MARTRRGHASELSESWDDVAQEDYSDEDAYTPSPDELDDERETRRNTRLNRANGDADATPRKRATRSSAEPELVMPSSPDALQIKQRAKTPHFRLNQRSMTSDAGDLDVGRKEKMGRRPQTPRMRMNQRSMTGDAGVFNKRAAVERDDEEYEDSAKGYLDLAWRRICAPLLGYIGEIVGLVLQNAKPLLAYAIFIYLIGAALVFGSGFLTNSINHALSPICRIPGVTTFFHPSFCPVQPTHEIQGTAEFDKLVQAQSAFDDVLSASSAGVNLPADMQRSASSIRDLRQVVRHSTLPSKRELEHEFDGFVATARQASDDLSKFNTHIGGAVDRILSINRWTLSTIDGVRASDEESRGSVLAFVNKHLNIFAPFRPVPLSRDLLLDQYLRHTELVEDKILALIDEAFALLAILENLDGRLDTIADIAARDGVKAEGAKDELLASLWTHLGGNRSSMSKLQKQLDLLQNVSTYRRLAWAHVSATILKLQAMRDQLEELRERVASPEVLAATEKVPLEVHVRSINLGIERLEEQRDVSRAAAMRGYREAVERAEKGVEGGRLEVGGREL